MVVRVELVLHHVHNWLVCCQFIFYNTWQFFGICTTRESLGRIGSFSVGYNKHLA